MASQFGEQQAALTYQAPKRHDRSVYVDHFTTEFHGAHIAPRASNRLTADGVISPNDLSSMQPHFTIINADLLTLQKACKYSISKTDNQTHGIK
jgi:hypothetical protein